MSQGSVTIVGPGRMGLALAEAFVRSGAFESVVVAGRHPEHPDHPVFEFDDVRYVFGLEPLPSDTAAVLLAVPDADVPEVAFAVAAHGPAPEGSAAFHLSGSLPTDVLAPLHERGFGVGVFQPLVALGSPLRAADRFAGASIAVTASPETLRTAWRLADALGATVVPVPAVRRPLFHAAVTLAVDALLPVLARSVRLMEQAGLSEDEAVEAVLPLVRTMLASLEEGGLPTAITGPLARADVETAALHLRALEPEDRRFYALVGQELLRLSEGMDGPYPVSPEDRDEIADLFRRTIERELSGAGVGS